MANRTVNTFVVVSGNAVRGADGGKGLTPEQAQQMKEQPLAPMVNAYSEEQAKETYIAYSESVVGIPAGLTNVMFDIGELIVVPASVTFNDPLTETLN